MTSIFRDAVSTCESEAFNSFALLNILSSIKSWEKKLAMGQFISYYHRCLQARENVYQHLARTIENEEN